MPFYGDEVLNVPQKTNLEDKWVDHVNESLHVEPVHTHTNLIWSAFHAKRSDDVGTSNACIEAILDQPLYDLAKKTQWTFPNSLGEDRFVVLLGGLHIEMALWSTLGGLLPGSGWPESLKEAGIVNSLAAATSFMKASNVMRTRYVHQVTYMVMNILRRQAYAESGKSVDIGEWISSMSKEYPTFKFWSLVLKYQRDIFLFIRANRERKINLMISALIELVPPPPAFCSGSSQLC